MNLKKTLLKKGRIIGVCFIIITIFVVLQFPLSESAETKEKQGETFHSSYDVMFSMSDNTMVLNFSLYDYQLIPQLINGNFFYSISINQSSQIFEKGCPDLPHICESIIIDDLKIKHVNISSSSYSVVRNISIAPSKGHLLRSTNPEKVPFHFGSIYQSDCFFPKEIVELRQSFIFRDVIGQTIILNPFQYNPTQNLLKIFDSLTITITFTDPLSSIESEKIRVPNSFSFLYETHFLNFRELNYTIVPEEGNLLVITYDDFSDDMESFVDWKNMKGVPTEIVNVSEAGGTAANIKNYIVNYYNNYGLTFVLLVGDINQVPTLTASGHASDPSYGYINGSDSYPEVFIGRFSAQNGDQLETMTNRTVMYEKNPHINITPSWFDRGLGVASNEGTGDDGEYDWEHMRNIRSDLLGFTYTLVDELYDGSHGGEDEDGNPSSSDVASSLNDGRSIVNYCGHGTANSWTTTGFSNTNVHNLENDGMLPFIISVACNNGQFDDYSECFCEAWLRSTNESSQHPTGAVAMTGSSKSMSWAPPMDAQDEMNDLLIEQYQNISMYTVGGIHVHGCMHMNEEYGPSGYDETDTWHIFGDPSLVIRTDTPKNMTVHHAATIPQHATTFLVTVINTSHALCALSCEGMLVGFNYTNSSGTCVIEVNNSMINTDDTLDLIITSFNAYPYSAEIPVRNSYDIFVDDDAPSSWYNETQVRTIQEGINNASTGDFIFVFNGTYCENILLNKTIHLVGEQKNNTIIDGGGNDSIIYVSEKDIQITGFTLKNGMDGIVCSNVSKIKIEQNLIQNISLYSGISIDRSNNITIKNNVIMNSTGAGIDIYLRSKDNSVKNNTIFYCGSGIIIANNSDGNSILNNTINDNNGSGIVLLYSSENNTIYYNTIVNNVNDGISLINSSYNLILTNELTNNTINGIDSWKCFHLRIENNSITCNKKRGILLSSSHFVSIRNNTLLQNNFSGIQLFSSSNNIMENNTCKQHTLGIILHTSINNTFLQNKCKQNNHTGIHIEQSSNNCILNNNSCTDNGYHGINLYNSSYCTILNNSCLRNTFDGIRFTITSFCSLLNNNVSMNHQEGIDITDGSNGNLIKNNKIFNNSRDGIQLDASPENNLSKNTIISNNNGVYIAHAQNNTLFNNSLQYNRQSGMFLTNSSFQTITQNYFLQNEWCGLKLGNGKIRDFLIQTTVKNNVFTHDGVGLFGSFQNIFLNNSVNNKPLLYLENESDVSITQQAGQIIIVNCYNISVFNQNLSYADNGVELWNSSHCAISNNNLSNNLIGSLILSNSNHNVLYSNNISNLSRHGVYIQDSTSNTISKNSITKSDLFGVCLYQASNTTLYNCSLVNNWDSVFLIFSYNNMFTENTITSNMQNGIIVYQSNYNVFSQNTIYNNSWGISVFQSTNNTIKGNHIHHHNKDTKGDGINLRFSNENNISYNEIRHNADAGIQLMNSSDQNNIQRNLISFNDWTGMSIWNSSSNLICKNTIKNNNISGVRIEQNSSNNTLYDNNFINQSMHAYDECANRWYSLFYNRGNYWDDYTGSDNDSDGIGDQPYMINGGDNQDLFPLMQPWNETIIESFILSFLSGWNLFTFSVETGWNASDVLSNVSAASMVSWYDTMNETYKTATSGGGYDFPLQCGWGYFVYVTNESNVTVNGSRCSNVSVPIDIGWNMIGWYHEHNTTATSLMENISNCTMISWYDTFSQTYKTVTPGGGYDFIITQGMGVFVYTDEASIWYGEG